MKKGRIELAIGPMFAGKTSWLIEKLAKNDSHEILTFKYYLDERYSKNHLATHDGKKLKASVVKSGKDIIQILKTRPQTKIIGIDELQFFESKISDLFQKLKEENLKVFIAGLNFDHNYKMWEATQATIPIADKVYKFKAICAICGKKNAVVTNRKGRKDERIVVGGSEFYEPLCLKDYLVLNKRTHNSL